MRAGAGQARSALLPWLFIVGVILAASTPALAEEGTAKEETRPSPEQLNKAKEQNQRGKELFNLGKFKQAAAAYDKAYKAVPLPAFLYNLGQCHARMDTVEELEKGRFYLETYLAKQPEAPNRAEVDKEIARLERKIETLKDYKKPSLLDVQGSAAAAATATTDKPIYKKWWFWTIVGAVVAGAAAGTAVALQPGENPPVDGSLWPKVIPFD